MEIKRLTKNENGEISSMWALTLEQEMFLINYAINSLLERGLAAVIEEEMKEEGTSTLSVLEGLDADKLPRA